MTVISCDVSFAFCVKLGMTKFHGFYQFSINRKSIPYYFQHMNADFVLINFSKATKVFPTKSPLKVFIFYGILCHTCAYIDYNTLLLWCAIFTLPQI